MPQRERTSGGTPPPPDQRATIVDALGNAETEDSRVPQTIIHREQLTPEQPEIRVDLDKLGGSSGEHVLNIVLQDFGLPFRTITVNRLFMTDDSEGEESTSSSSGNKLDKVAITCPSRSGWAGGKTERYIVDNDVEEGNIVLEPGRHFFFAHDGNSSDFRTGFIFNDAQIVAFDEKWESPESIKQLTDQYTPLIKIAYEGNTLIITGYDDANAEVVYEKVVSQADAITTGENPAARTREQVLEVALARSRGLLIETQGKLQAALFEIEQLKRTRTTDTSQRAQAFGFGTERAASNDPYEYCRILGIDPDMLFNMKPGEAERLVLGMRRIYAGLYHPDTNPSVNPEVLSRINDAADKVVVRIKTGSWGRN